MCHGNFDIVHPGHIRHLMYASSKADILIASLTCDAFITKGNNRPYIPEELRAINLSVLDIVDFVIIDKNAKPLVSLETLKLIRTNSLSKNLFPIEITAVNTVKDEHYENDLDGYGWGLGFRVLMNNTAQNKYGVIGEFGWSGYAATYFLVDPINDLSAVLMMQILDADKNIKKDFYNNIFKSFK